MTRSKTFYSKISYGLLVILFLVFYGSLIPIYITDGITINISSLFVMVSLVYGCIVYLFFNTTYTITPQHLIIKCGFIRYKPIPIKSITSMAKSSNIISSPAASFDRIEIRYGKFDEIILSPKNKSEFAAYLKQLNPKIENRIEN
ncbi:PH domain-containing protein [Winogradskyella arenosi]|uniref:PH (Pleckstrin Homology) domain-containing protein n=1 Tax=Winogradskyella arenosi TaxID=533325 RepID=A0A368ZKK3_9FLAO|nr:PH domain-containing protein [Winogradskyella arenosi]RCW93435.1 PH (Pleckstrin Homology) domain-containing protein [Winogradskyella arenosi]